MPYLHCEKSKQKIRIDIKICFENLCPYFLDDGTGNYGCGFKSNEEKKVEKRKKK